MNKEIFKNSNLSEQGFEELKEKFRKKEIHLSYSKLKNLTSPINFTMSLINKSKPNLGMSFGSAVDMYQTERGKFNSTYKVGEVKISAGNQEKVVEEILSGNKKIPIQERFETAFKSVYSKGKIEDYTFLLDYCISVEMGVKLIPQEEMDKIIIVANGLLNNEEASFILSTAVGLQEKIEFKYRGWKFICYLDILEENGFTELKFESKFDPAKFRFSIEKYGYDIQMAIYSRAFESVNKNIVQGMKARFIVYDDKGNNSVIRYADDYMAYSRKKLDVYINRLEHIIKEDAWFESYDFFNPNRAVHKPSFVDGFSEYDLQSEEE